MVAGESVDVCAYTIFMLCVHTFMWCVHTHLYVVCVSYSPLIKSAQQSNEEAWGTERGNKRDVVVGKTPQTWNDNIS